MIKTVNMLFGLILLAGSLTAQTPTGLSEVGDEPVEFNAVKILLYIIFPIAMMVAYILLRRRQVKRRKEELQQRKES